MTRKASISFDTMFGNAQEFIPDPETINEEEFASLDEEDAGGEDDLDDITLEGIEAAIDEAIEDEEDDLDYGYADEEDEEGDIEETDSDDEE